MLRKKNGDRKVAFFMEYVFENVKISKKHPRFDAPPDPPLPPMNVFEGRGEGLEGEAFSRKFPPPFFYTSNSISRSSLVRDFHVS